ncbi:TPA: CHAP domain-containing protein [Streptococcus agalactiae]
MADRTYGHVAIVEDVKEDGSIPISESNVLGLGTISYRTFSAAEAAQLTYVVGEK